MCNVIATLSWPFRFPFRKTKNCSNIIWRDACTHFFLTFCTTFVLVDITAGTYIPYYRDELLLRIYRTPWCYCSNAICESLLLFFCQNTLSADRAGVMRTFCAFNIRDDVELSFAFLLLRVSTRTHTSGVYATQRNLRTTIFFEFFLPFFT